MNIIIINTKWIPASVQSKIWTNFMFFIIQVLKPKKCKTKLLGCIYTKFQSLNRRPWKGGVHRCQDDGAGRGNFSTLRMSRQWVTTRLLQTTSWKVNHIKHHVHTFSIMCLWYCKFGIELYWCCNISSFIKRCHTLFYSKVFQNIYPPFLIFQLSLATLHAKKNTKFPSGLWYIHRTSQFMVVRKKHQTRKMLLGKATYFYMMFQTFFIILCP